MAETSRPSIPDLALALPWGHHAVLLERLEAQAARRWYAERIRAEGWSRARLEAEIEKDAYARQGRAQNNFARALPDAQSALAQEALKDPYNFDFLTLGPKAPERVAERGLLAHVREFLLELGAGFAFVGSQVKLTVEGRDSYLDLLFFHVKLRCYVVVELKARRFKPEFVGKLNYYLSAVDDLLRGPEDRPTIGLLLCKSRRKVEVEYALRGVAKPIGIADWRDKIADRFPAAFAGSLPTVEEIEAELSSRPKRAARRGKP